MSVDHRQRDRLPVLLRIARSCRTIWPPILFICFSLWSISVLHAAEDGEHPTTAPPLHYRRIFVPANDMAAWPREGEKLLPIEVREFNDLVASANNSTTAGASAATNIEAVYTATLIGEQLVGTGEWKVELHSPTPAIQRFDPGLPRISNPTWSTSPPSPARFGWWGSSANVPLTYGLEIARAGTLTFDWTARPTPIREGAEFSFHWPPAVLTRLILDLQLDKRPELPGSQIVESNVNETAKRPLAPGFKRWLLTFGPSIQSILVIRDLAHSRDSSDPVATIDERLQYKIDQRGMHLTATFRLTDWPAGVRQVEVPLPSGARLTSAVADGLSLTWRLIAQSASSPSRAVVELPVESADGQPAIELHVWQELLLDEPWILSTLRPDGVEWRAGSAELTIAPGLECRGIQPTGYRQTDAQLSSVDELQSEVHTFVADSPSASLSTTIGRTLDDAAVRMGASFTAGELDLSGRIVSEVEVARGSRLELTADLLPGWIIESVETIPLTALGDWSIDRSQNVRRLVVQLAHAALPARPVTIVANVRLLRSQSSGPLSAESLQVIAWHEAEVLRRLVFLQPPAGRFVQADSPITTIDPRNLDATERALLVDPIAGPTFDVSNAGPQSMFRMIEERGQFAADIELDAVLAGAELSHSAQIRLEFSAGRPEPIYIYFTEPLVGDVRWVDAATGSLLAAERLSSEHPQRGQFPASADIWQIRLPAGSSEVVRLTATANLPWTSRGALPLVAVAGASTQRGRVQLRAIPSVELEIEPQSMQRLRLTPSQSQGPAPADQASVRAAFQFSPASTIGGTGQPRLWMSGKNADETTLVKIERFVLESAFAESGKASHFAAYELENLGAAHLRFRIAEGVQLIRAELDGRPVSYSITEGQDTVTIPIPTNLRHTQLNLVLAGKQPPLGAGGDLRPPLSGMQPPLAGEWTIRLPQDFTVVHRRQRLIGSLAPHSADVVDPKLKSAALGWVTYRIPLVAEYPQPITITSLPVTTSGSLASFVLAFAAGLGLRQFRSCVIIVLAAIACAALTFPATAAPLAAGALLGLSLSQLGGTWFPNTGDEISTKLWNQESPAGAAIAICLVLFSSDLAGQETKLANPTTPALHSVFIPTDAGGQFVGDKVYLGEQFLTALLDATADSTHRGKWLITAAEYQFELGEQYPKPGIVPGNCSLSFDLEVLTRNAVVPLAISRGNAVWNSAALDGIPCELHWHPSGDVATVAIPEPGRYRLQINFTPAVVSSGGHRQIVQSLSAIPGAAVKLSYPSALVGLRSAGLAPVKSANERPGLLVGEAETGRPLVISWPQQDLLLADALKLQVHELRWLQVSDDGVLLSLKYVVEGPRRPTELIVHLDRRWEPLNDNAQSTPVSPDASALEAHAYSLKLPSNFDVRGETALRFRLVDARPPANLRLPRIELRSHRVATRWLAVSSSANVECKLVGAATADSKPSEEFLAAWFGQAPLQPSASDGSLNVHPPQIVASSQSDGYLAWRVDVGPRRSSPKIDDSLQIAADAAKLRVHYRADVTPSDTYQFQVPIRVPPPFVVDQVLARSAGTPLPLRWVRSRPNEVRVFLSGTSDSDYRLTVAGHVPLPAANEVPIPRIEIEKETPTSPPIWLYRQEDVLVEVRGATTLSSIEQPRELPEGWHGRLVGAFSSVRDQPLAQLRVSANQPLIAADSAILLTHEGGRWWATWNARVAVSQGVLDALRLRIPASWSGPFDAPPGVVVETTARKETTSDLSLRLPKSVAAGEAIEISLRAPLTHAVVPNITPLTAADWSQRVTVPTVVDSAAVHWSTDGVRAAEPTDQIVATPSPLKDSDGRTRTFVTTSESFRVSLDTAAARPLSASVRLADTTVLQGLSGGWVAQTRFVIVPGNLAECQLLVPEDQHLVSIGLDGQPALSRSIGNDRWIVHFEPSPLPRILDVMSCAPAANHKAAAYVLRRPQLFVGETPLPVEMGLWSIGRPSGLTGQPLSSDATVTAANQTATRLERLIGIVEAATPAAAALPTPVREDWCRVWASFFAMQKSPRQSIASSPQNFAAVEVPLTTNQQLTDAWQRIDRWRTQISGGQNRSTADVTPLLWHTLYGTAADFSQLLEWSHFVVDGSTEQISLENAWNSSADLRYRAAGLLAVLGLAAVSLWAVRRTKNDPGEWFGWPALGLLGGLFSLVWLSTNWLGWLVIAVSAMAAAKQILASRPIRLSRA